MFPWAPQAALAAHTAGRRALAAVRLALSFLLLEDDHEVDWEVDWDQSAELAAPTTARAAPSYGASAHRHPPSVGRRYRRHERRRHGQPAPRLQPCIVEAGATGAPTARARHRCQTPRSAGPPCRVEAGIGDGGRRDRGEGR